MLTRDAEEVQADKQRSTARRSGSDRREHARRSELHGDPWSLANAEERRTLLRRIQLRRSPLDRRAPYRNDSVRLDQMNLAAP